MKNILYRLKRYFDPYIPTRLADWRSLTSYLALEQIKKRTTVKFPGEKEEFLRFVLEGAAAMTMQEDAKEVCFDLCFEDDFLTDFLSLSSGKPTNVHIRTFEPLWAVIIERSSLLKIYGTSFLGAQLGRVLAEQQNIRSQKNHIGYLGKPAEERYRKLLRERPQVTLRTPQYYLASYLGVSTENLSRIRRRMGRKI